MVNQLTISERRLALMWGANILQWEALLFIESKGGAIQFDDYKLSGQPGETLRLMIRKGWLDGPAPNEKPRKRPWSLTEEGRALLAKVRRKLRPPTQLTPSQFEVLDRLGSIGSLKDTHPATITSLRKIGYVKPHPSLELTELGREAFTDLQLYMETHE